MIFPSYKVSSAHVPLEKWQKFWQKKMKKICVQIFQKYQLNFSIQIFSVENNYCFQTHAIGQSLAFNTQDPALKFGLIQKSGGPCGLLAVVQAYILKYLLFQGTVL